MTSSIRHRTVPCVAILLCLFGMVRTIGFDKLWARFCVVTGHVVADAVAFAVVFSRLSTTSHTNTGCCCDFADVLNAETC